MRIRQLSPHVFNQIAAGEVIERPASVVKELLENALDAGATTLTIELGFGGLNLIKISDNGHGIDAEDLPLAITAHATSKIQQLEDLYTITTMGFRGEALASIASVSRMRISSKPPHQNHGHMLRIDEHGIYTELCPRNQGTTIEIRDLFYNTPVRKTFLKSERIEYQAIELVVKQFALAAPNIAIHLYHNQKLILQLPTAQCDQTRLRRIKKLFGQAFLNDALPIYEEHAGLIIQGWISHKTYQRSQRDKQWIYLNDRMLKDKLIFQAIAQAYQDSLYPGRYAACILYLTIDPDQVDVNVHPTKHEVRFRDPRMVHAFIVASLGKYVHTSSSTSVENAIFKPQIPSHAALNQTHTLSDPVCMILNSQFAILNLPNSLPHLVDMLALHAAYLTNLLKNTSMPLPYRALLVPIRIALLPNTERHLEQQRSQLGHLGIQFDFIGTEHLLIRTIPLALPLLNLETFFLAIQKVNYDQDALIQQLIAHQTFDAYNMTPIERETLQDFCMQATNISKNLSCCLPLDVTHCQHIMRQHRFTPEKALAE